MKRILLALFTLLILSACSNENVEINIDQDNNNQTIQLEEVDEVITDIVSEQEHDVVLFDNDDLKMTLLHSFHERYENARGKDKIELTLELENRNNRTFELLIDEFKLDGTETNDMKTFFDADEIAPNETINIKLTTFTETGLDDFELNFKEHLSGTVIFSDHEGNEIDVSFSEYIIEQ